VDIVAGTLGNRAREVIDGLLDSTVREIAWMT